MGGARRAHLILLGAPPLGTYTDCICIQYARARPNFWSAHRPATNFLLCAVAISADWPIGNAMQSKYPSNVLTIPWELFLFFAIYLHHKC